MKMSRGEEMNEFITVVLLFFVILLSAGYGKRYFVRLRPKNLSIAAF